MIKVAFVFLMFFSLGATLTMLACKRMKRKFDDKDSYESLKDWGV